MVLGSHNAWSYLRPKKWWMTPFAFIARCQRVSIMEQHEKYGVGCFDLRIRFNNANELEVAHGLMVYRINKEELFKDLSYIDSNGGIVRVLHEVRSEKEYTEEHKRIFIDLCDEMVKVFPSIKFYHGKNLYNWEVDYQFANDFTEEGVYSSVCKPRLIDDWFPWLFARFNNKKTIEKGTDKDILLIDFVNIQ